MGNVCVVWNVRCFWVNVSHTLKWEIGCLVAGACCWLLVFQKCRIVGPFRSAIPK